MSILKGRDLLKANGNWLVGNGQSLDLRTDRWLASGKLAVVKDSAPATKVADCLNTFGTGWDLQILRQTLHHDSAMDAVKTPISINGGIDTFWWPHAPNGSYTVKSGYFVTHAAPAPPQRMFLLPWCFQRSFGGRFGRQRNLKK